MKDEKIYLLKFLNSGSVYFKLVSPSVWDSAGSVYNSEEKTLFLPVLNKYRKDANLENFTVRMGPNKGNEYILVKGELKPATSQEDIDYVFNELINDWQWDPEKAHYALYDKRNGKPRNYRYKLKIKKINIHNNDSLRELGTEVL